MSIDLLSIGRETYNKELETWISKEKAIRRLRHSSRSKHLKAYLG